jgi:hypothetical protein
MGPVQMARKRLWRVAVFERVLAAITQTTQLLKPNPNLL